MSERFAISVLTSNYNYARFLRECLDSVVQQSVPPFEFIIVDDASTDDSAEIIASYSRRFPFIRFVRNDRNKGFFANMEFLLAEAKGTHFVSLASDDRLEPGYFAAAAEAAVRYPEAALLFGDWMSWNHANSRSTFCRYGLGEAVRYVPPAEAASTLGVRHPHGQSIVRREALRAIGGYPAKFRWHNDWFAHYHLAFVNGFVYLPGCWSMLRVHGASYSGRIPEWQRFHVVRQMFEYLRCCPPAVRSSFIESNALANLGPAALAAALVSRGSVGFLTGRFFSRILSPQGLFSFVCGFFSPEFKKPIKRVMRWNSTPTRA